MVKIDCNCIDGNTKIYLRNLILSDLENARLNMQTALGLSKPKDVPNIMKSHESISKNISEILIEVDKVGICKAEKHSEGPGKG